jgi:hypothetical protein
MKIENQDLIMKEAKERVNNLFEAMENEVNEMLKTKQLTIHTAEETMSFYMNSMKAEMVKTAGILLSNIDTENETNTIEYKNEKLKPLKKTQK